MKYLSDDDVKFKSLERYLSLKKRFNKPDINDWYEKTYRHAKSIGYVSQFFKKNKPSSFENAYDLYTLSGFLDTGLPKEERGRTKEELEELADRWKADCGVDLPLVDFYDALVLHAVVETCFGIIMEKKAQEAYQCFGFVTTETSGDDDSGCGIDFIAEKDDNTILVQVKPISFFLGRKEDLRKDRWVVWLKHERGLEKFPGATYAYMIYDNDGKWLKKDGKFNHHYEELVNKNGEVIANILGQEYTREEKLC